MPKIYTKNGKKWLIKNNDNQESEQKQNEENSFNDYRSNSEDSNNQNLYKTYSLDPREKQPKVHPKKLKPLFKNKVDERTSNLNREAYPNEDLKQSLDEENKVNKSRVRFASI